MKLVDFLITRLFQLADYVCSKTSKSTIRFTDADRMVVGELFK